MTVRGFRVFRASILALAGSASLVASGGIAAQTQDPQRPAFRTTTNLVRVDAYPTRNGKIIRGLAMTDFEVLEDGVPQKIESFQFVEFPQNNPLEERRDPNSQREGFQLAADPSYRVFVLYLDNLHVDFTGSHEIRVPLITFLNRVLGPKDLFGVMTTAQNPDDLMLGQQTLYIEEQLTKYWDWGRGARVLEDDEDLMIQSCFPNAAPELVRRRRLDEVFTDLEGVIVKLADIREERKNILVISNGWDLPGRMPQLRELERPMPPRVGVTNAGKLSTGRSGAPGEFDPKMCEAFMQRLSEIDFEERHRDLIALARRSNVTFYALRPAGLAAPATAEGIRRDRMHVDSLITLSQNTDGISVVNTNDLTTGARRIADDLEATYLLGYYPSNNKADGRIRKITVRLKPDGGSVRARREYRAPSEGDLAALRAAADVAPAPVTPVDEALAALRRTRPGAIVATRGAVIGDQLVLVPELTAPEIEAGRWKAGAEIQVVIASAAGDVMTTARGRIDPGQRSAIVRVPLSNAPGPFTATVRVRNATDGTAEDGLSVARTHTGLGDPLVFRVFAAGTPRPAGAMQFRRTERLIVKWPVAGEAASPQVRVLGRDGVPLDLKSNVSTETQDGITYLVADLNLAPLTAGEYVLDARAAASADRPATLAFRVTR